MQLKGLIRFFTVLLIIYSIYELSFTWVVRSHERKMEAKAKSIVDAGMPNTDAVAKEQAYKTRLKRLLDSTKDETVHYGIQGAISYQQAKENELNLGLDLQGGINVTMEVELSGLLRSMSNGSKDPNFLKALENANLRKANSNADYVTLFVEEYKKLAPNARLASLFANSSNENIKINDADDKVVGEIRKEAAEAFNRTFRVLRTRIDQFGVAQPNINPDPARGIITVELPGVQDQERVRKYLQSSANLQFWEVYNISELGTSIGKADEAFNVLMGGKTAAATTATDTTAKPATDTAVAKAAADTGTKLSAELGDKTGTAASKNATDTARKTLWQYISFMVNPQTGQAVDNGQIGMVAIRDTAIVRTYLQNGAVAAHFPADVLWAYGIPETGTDNKKNNFVSLYGIKTKGLEKAPLEGEAVVEARSDFNPTTNQPEVTMKMNPAGAHTWANLTRANKGRFVAIVLDNIVYSAPRVNDAIEGGNSSISGSFTPEESSDLANILKAGKLPAPAKIVQEQVVGPTLGADAIRGGLIAFTPRQFFFYTFINKYVGIYRHTDGKHQAGNARSSKCGAQPG